MAAGYLPAEKAVGRPRGSKMKGRKVAPKYRNPKNRSETWAGRGHRRQATDAGRIAGYPSLRGS